MFWYRGNGETTSTALSLTCLLRHLNEEVKEDWN